VTRWRAGSPSATRLERVKSVHMYIGLDGGQDHHPLQGWKGLRVYTMIRWRAGSPSVTRLEGLKVYTYISDEVPGRLASATRLERVNILAYSCLLFVSK